MPLVCPHCGRSVREGALTCPYCHASLDVTQRLSLSDATWCPDCGALLAPGTERCPKCGRPAEGGPRRRVRKDMNLPDIGSTGVIGSSEELSGTPAGPRIESAIPPADGESSPGSARDHLPRPRAFAFAALFAVLVVGGAALLITHPWDPTASITRASEPADTSMSGFPGLIESLTGQDKTSQGDGATTADAFDAIDAAHAELGELEEAVGESESALRAACSGDGDADVEAGLEEAHAVSLRVSNLISEVGLLDDSDEAYAEDLENLLTLGNWLRNRCDALTSAWELAADADDPVDVADSVASTLNGARDYDRLFAQNYGSWAPERAEE